MGFELTDFDSFLGKDAKERANEKALAADTSQYRVIEPLTAAQLLVNKGKVHRRPISTQPFPKHDGVLHIIYGDEARDLMLTDVHSATETWTIDTETGGQIHLHCADIRKGLGSSARRKIDVLGSGALVVHFMPQALEDALLVEKNDMIFIQLLYTKGIIIRGNVKFACNSADGDINEIPLKTFLQAKHQRVKDVAGAPVTQQDVQKLNKAQEKAVELGKINAGNPQEKKGIRLGFDLGSRKPTSLPPKPGSGQKR